MFVSGESIEAKRSLSDSVLIKQLAKKNSCPPQVLNYSELPGPAWPVPRETRADLLPATLRVGLTSDRGCLLADIQSSPYPVIQDRLIREPTLAWL